MSHQTTIAVPEGLIVEKPSPTDASCVFTSLHERGATSLASTLASCAGVEASSPFAVPPPPL
jgi:hypothetical protein